MDYNKELIASLKNHINILQESNKMLEAWYERERVNKDLLKVALYCALYFINNKK